MEKFDASLLIKLLDFLARFKEALDALYKLETIAVRVLEFLLEGAPRMCSWFKLGWHFLPTWPWFSTHFRFLAHGVSLLDLDSSPTR